MQSLATEKKSVGVIPKNYINKETGLIDFPLRTLVANKDEYQETGRNELVFTSLRIVEECELEIIEAQNLDQELVVMLKEKAREIGLKKEREIEFYIDGSLGKEEEKGIMGVGWIGIDRIDSSLVSIGNFKVVNWPTSTKAELLGIWVVLLIVQCNTTVRVLTDSEQAIESITKACNAEQYSK